MAKYRVYLEAVASVAVEVDADSEDEAIDLAHENTPSKAWDWPDLGEWYFPGDEEGRKQSDYIEKVSD